MHKVTNIIAATYEGIIKADEIEGDRISDRPAVRVHFTQTVSAEWTFRDRGNGPACSSAPAGVEAPAPEAAAEIARPAAWIEQRESSARINP